MSLSLLEILWKLGLAHAITDIVMQDGKLTNMGRNKIRGQHPHWFYWLIAHGLIQGGGVYWATGLPLLGLAESVAHTVIDFGKCEHYYGVHVDQGLHLLCKIVWALIFVGVIL